MNTKIYTVMRNKLLRTCAMLCFALTVGTSTYGQCTYYLDWDGDGYGNPSSSYVDPACGLPVSGYVLNNLDCDDSEWDFVDNDNDGFGTGPSFPCGGENFAHFPGDCDDNQRLYSDNDHDGFGALPFVPCNGVANGDDCDDSQFRFTDNDGDGFGVCFAVF